MTRRARSHSPAAGQAGQATLLMLAVAALLLVAAGGLGALGRALLGKGRYQRAADLAAVSAARSMRDDFSRLFEPVRGPDGRANPRHLEKRRYRLRAEAAAIEAARANGARGVVRVDFPAADDLAPVRVRVRLSTTVPVRVPAEHDRERGVEFDSAATAELIPPSAAPRTVPSGPTHASGGGYSGPLAYRQGKPMRPDVASAFDVMAAAARRAGLSLIVTSGYRSDAEQARLFAAHPDPRWVAPPGRSLHRYGTELDLGPPAAYGWLAANARRFGFLKRYSWEPWHFGYVGGETQAPRPDAPIARTATAATERALPAFVPARYAGAIGSAAQRWNVPAELLAAQLYAESGFNPFARSPVGALGIAQFMPATARSYGLRNPFDADASIMAQAHFMHELLARFGGSIPLALAAYNAGAGAVARYGGIPPYPETRAYVAKIVALMGGAGALPAAPPRLEVRLVS
jgi:hypothetical protein